ncbi:hypothetical protein BAE44_0000406 [Dichanthelium oligosanthes]|uniref:Uncharacterized protein n=1 Tax=Dichanthelium oligosanthes TaxID=888268 RepID=A0A1E5WMF1_9POAL|nr:hypothetical protein BAE44_0000406 [Dichanthelium oligosanthes]
MDEEDEVVLVVCGEECDSAPMFDIHTGEEILRIHDCLAHPLGLTCVAGCLLATSRQDKDQLAFDSAIYFWDLNKISELLSGRLLCILTLFSPITTTDIDPLEQLIICGASDGAIYVTGLIGIGMQYTTKKLAQDDCQVLYGHKAPISALAFSSEGVWLVSGSKDCTVLIWNTTTWNVVRKLGNKMGPVTNLLVIPKPDSSRVNTKNYLSLQIPTLEKKFKETNETPIVLQPSSFSKDTDSAQACFHSSNLLSKQILDLEGKRTPEAIEMTAAMTDHEQTKDRNSAKELSSMTSVLQCKALRVMEIVPSSLAPKNLDSDIRVVEQENIEVRVILGTLGALFEDGPLLATAVKQAMDVADEAKQRLVCQGTSIL